MSSSEAVLSPRVLGGEVLARLARARATGLLTWSVSPGDEGEAQLVFQGGRPQGAIINRGQQILDRAQVVGFVRTFALLSRGKCHFDAKQVTVAQNLDIDTLGEVMMALLKALSSQDMDAIWKARAGYEVAATAAFDRFAATIAKVNAAELRKPLPGTKLGALAAGGTPATQRGWVVLLTLGGLDVTRAPETSSAPKVQKAAPKVPPPVDTAPAGDTGDEPAQPDGGEEKPTTRRKIMPPKDPGARRLFFEIEKGYDAAKDANFYEILDVPNNSSAETIRKAYFERAKQWHSDRFSSAELDPAMQERAAELFRQVEDAYKVLGDEGERKTYNYILDRRAKGLPTDPKVIMEAEGLFKKGQALVRKGRAAAAEPLLREALEINPGEAEFWIYHGFSLYAAKGRRALQEATEKIDKGLGMNERLAAGFEFRGRILRIEGDAKGAMRALKEALEINPKNVDAQRELRLMTMRKTTTGSEKQRSDNSLGGLLNKMLKR